MKNKLKQFLLAFLAGILSLNFSISFMGNTNLNSDTKNNSIEVEAKKTIFQQYILVF